MSYGTSYTDADRDFILENLNTLSVEEIAARLNRSVWSVYQYMRVHGISHPISHWTPEQTQALLDSYATDTTRVIAEKTGHCWSACKTKAREFGLTRESHHAPPWTRREIELFDKLVKANATYEEMETVIHRSRHALHYRKWLYYPGSEKTPWSPVKREE